MVWKLYLICSLFLLGNLLTFAQSRNNVWCFGDSAGIDFNVNAIPITSSVVSRGSCSSICDSTGSLLFYSSYDADLYTIGGPAFAGGEIYNMQNVLMQNGDSTVMGAWYNESVIIDVISMANKFYVFSIGVTGNFGIYYSMVDMNQNGGLGVVTQKNVQLQSFANVDCINAIKHGNGRDWWIIFRESGGSPGNPNNDFYQYQITPNGISNVFVQNVGSINSTNLGKITFSKLGDKMVYNSYRGLLELYDYDRCTGVISNPVTIFQESILPPYNHFWGSEFSPDGSKLYVTISDQTSYLFQFDLNAPNIPGSIDTLWSTSFPGEAIGGLKRGPDGKIYESGPYTSSAFFVYPYPDSVYNMYNMNLGVINSPDSSGAACNFQPYSFYLGGKRTYWGLPNNPDYDLGPVAGSICDTLVSLPPTLEGMQSNPELHVYYSPKWQTAFINANKLVPGERLIRVLDLQGKVVFEETSSLSSSYYTKNLNCTNFAKGMYLVLLQTERERWVKRFVVE